MVLVRKMVIFKGFTQKMGKTPTSSGLVLDKKTQVHFQGLRDLLKLTGAPKNYHMSETIIVFFWPF